MANHIVSAAMSLPAMIERRETGVTSRLSRVPRSRSPLMPSALTTSVTSTPTATASCRTRLTDSRCSRKFRAWLVEVRYVTPLSRMLKRKSKIKPRPLVHRSRVSCSATKTHPDCRSTTASSCDVVTSGGAT